MNQVLDTITNRRSVRQYAARALERADLEAIINAGNSAPSGMNAQGWRFIVVQDAAFRKQLAAAALPFYKQWLAAVPEEFRALRAEIDAHTDDPVYYNAPAIVFVVGFGMSADLDTPMVCENMMLAARSLGVGSCWVYFGQMALQDPAVKIVLALQPGEKVYGPILLGYPQEGFPESPAKKPATVTWR
jgi:nitroreductase